MFNSTDHIHCVGVGGAGVSAVALFAKQAGATVTGTDLAASAITQMLQSEGVQVRINSNQLPGNATHVIYSPAVPQNDPQLEEAKQRGVAVLSYPEALGAITGAFKTRIAVAGTNGKSTTTAMLASMFEEAGLNPTVIIGSLVPAWGNKNFRAGSNELMIVEVSEWQDHFHEVQPTHAIVTNIEEEHMDYFRDKQHLMESFSTFIRPAQFVATNAAIPKDALMGLATKQHSTFGSDSSAQYGFGDVQVDSGSQVVTIKQPDSASFDVRLNLPGTYNIENALGAIAMAKHFGVSEEHIQHALTNFKGIWRRFEKRGEYQGALVYSDYGHHPTAVRATIEGARQFFPDSRIVLVFQPHLHSRTEELFEDFCKAFQLADHVILTEIYDVAGRGSEQDAVSSQDFSRCLNANSTTIVKGIPEAAKELSLRAKTGDIIMIMGAGDIDQLANQLNNHD